MFRGDRGKTQILLQEVLPATNDTHPIPNSMNKVCLPLRCGVSVNLASGLPALGFGLIL